MLLDAEAALFGCAEGGFGSFSWSTANALQDVLQDALQDVLVCPSHHSFQPCLCHLPPGFDGGTHRLCVQ